MYQIAVYRDFIARHFLSGGDWGRENEKHSHHYRVEVCIEGPRLDEHGYLVDIVEIETITNETVDYLKDKILNDLPEFTGINPSIEHLAHYFCLSLVKNIRNRSLSALQVKIWENENAWASYRQDL